MTSPESPALLQLAQLVCPKCSTAIQVFASWRPAEGETATTTCEYCGGTRVVLASELPCPMCDPAKHLAERVLRAMPTTNRAAWIAARVIRGEQHD